MMNTKLKRDKVGGESQNGREKVERWWNPWVTFFWWVWGIIGTRALEGVHWKYRRWLLE